MLDLLAPDASSTWRICSYRYGLLVGAERVAYEVMRCGKSDQDYIDAMMRRGDDLLSEPRIKLSTFHAMKGGEDDNCVVYTCSTAACVNSDHPDDEHRAFYVGVTRASAHVVHSTEQQQIQVHAMKRDEVLDTAKELINGQRAKDYGDAYDNHSRIAEGWNIIIGGALKSHGHVTPAHVALMMDWVKTCAFVENI